MRDERETESRGGARPRVEPSSALVPNPEYVTLKLAVFATCRVTFVYDYVRRRAHFYNTRTHTQAPCPGSVRECGEIRSDSKIRSRTSPLETNI